MHFYGILTVTRHTVIGEIMQPVMRPVMPTSSDVDKRIDRARRFSASDDALIKKLQKAYGIELDSDDLALPYDKMTVLGDMRLVTRLACRIQAKIAKKQQVTLVHTWQSVRIDLLELLEQGLGVAAGSISITDRWTDDVSVDAMQLLTIVAAVEDMFNVHISDDTVYSFVSVKDLYDYVWKHVKKE